MSGKFDFKIEHVFKKFDSMKLNRYYWSVKSNQGGSVWKVGTISSRQYFYFYLICAPKGAENWALDVDVSMSIGDEQYTRTLHLTPNFNAEQWVAKIPACRRSVYTAGVFGGNLAVEFTVKIQKVNTMEKLINFDEAIGELSDVVLVVGDQKFYLLKKFLALHSSYFNSLLLGNFVESEKSEIILKDVEAQDFRNFLELIHGESLVEDDNVEGILKLADMYDSKVAIKRCEKFLIEASTKTNTEKFKMAVKYNLGALKIHTLPQLQTADDIESVVPENIDDLDHSVWKELVLKALDLPGNLNN